MRDYTTPIFKQYETIKKQYPDVILMFKVKDDYITFDSDAKNILSLRDFPNKQVDIETKSILVTYVPKVTIDKVCEKVITQGYRIAVCDQIY